MSLQSPIIVTSEQQIEARQRDFVLPQCFISKFPKLATTPSVKNVEHWICQNTVGVTITNFLDGQEGQELTILGEGQTTLAQNATIVLNGGSGGAILLANKKVYFLILINSVWYGNA